MSELTLQAARRIDPRRVGLALAAVWGVFAICGIAVETGYGDVTLAAFKLADSDLDRRLSMPASFTALLLLLAAGIAFALADVDRTRRRRPWRLAAVALALFGLEELLGAHAWLEARGVGWTMAYAPLLALGGVALCQAVSIFNSQRIVQVGFAAAVGLLVAGGVLDDPNLIASNAPAQLVQMAAAGALALCLLERLRYLARRYYPLEEADTRLSADQLTSEAIDRLRLRPIAAGLVLVTAAFAIQDVFLHTGNYHGHRVPILDVNAQQTLWATFKGSLIFVVALLALVIGRLNATPADDRRSWTLLGAVLAILGTDEIVTMHHRFQTATDLPGQTLLIPVAIIGVVAWWQVLGAISGNRRARFWFVTGAVLWLASQAIDVLFQETFRWWIVPEESLETLGSTCWFAALVIWSRALLPARLIEPDIVAERLGGSPPIAAPSTPEEPVRAPTG